MSRSSSGITAAATAFTSELMGTEPALAPAAPPPSKPSSFWPNGARMAVSLSLMFEADGQPISGAGGFLTEPIQAGLPDLPTNALFAYGYAEGIPRVLDLMDKHGIKLSSFMIGRAVENQPELAREIVRRGTRRRRTAAPGKTVTTCRPTRTGNSSRTAQTPSSA
jgi:Polysaccharide deacetylase